MKLREIVQKEAFLTMMRLLSKKNYFSLEMINKLKDKGFDVSVIQSAVKDATVKGYLNDIELARQYARRYQSKGWAPLFIQLKIYQKAKKTFTFEELELKEDPEESKKRILDFFAKKKAPKPFHDNHINLNWIARCHIKGFNLHEILSVIEEEW